MKISLAFLLMCLVPLAAEAQIVPDRSLGGESSTVREQVIQSLPSTLIEGGVQRNARLFHSFEQFNISPGRGAFFTNPAGITQIITRVTGGNASQLNGTLGVLGTADLILINPFGIQFGATARLNIAGSLLATTADRLEFEQWNFDARTPQSVPLLTVSAPIGLGFLSGIPGAIQVEGTGHQLNLLSGFTPVVGAGQQTGLTGGVGRSVALVGGEVNVNGGVVTAPSGDLSVGSVRQGQVTIKNVAGRWQFDYSRVTQLQDITLQRLSLLDASGIGSTGIDLTGNSIRLIDGSFVVLQNQGLLPTGTIRVHAQDLTLFGDSSNPVIRTEFLGSESKSGILSESFLGQGSNIEVVATTVNLLTAGGLRTTTFGEGNSGNLSVEALQSIQVTGFSPRDRLNSVSIVQTVAFASGQAGSVSLNTGDLSITNGGQVLSGTQGTGNGGAISIAASRGVTISGGRQEGLSILVTGSLGVGNAGDVSITSPVVNVLGGGQLGASSTFIGSSGNISIFADRVTVSGYFTEPSNQVRPSLINADAFSDPIFQAFGLPTPPVLSDSGTITITAREIEVSNGAQIRVLNTGAGNAGNIQLNADRLLLNNGSLSAVTSNGNGGDIEVQADRRIVLRQGSSITATAAGQGLGGNIRVWTPALAVLDSRVSADAQFNTGGQIFVSTQGFFRSRDTLITATSALGPQFDGQVQLNAPEVDVTRAILPPPAVSNPPPIASICGKQSAQQSNFTETGTGGSPQSPAQKLPAQEGWHDRASADTGKLNPALPQQPLIVEAQGLIVNADGTLELVADTGDGGKAPSFTSSCLPSLP
jgi:filamentous hemagglutinin family protein